MKSLPLKLLTFTLLLCLANISQAAISITTSTTLEFTEAASGDTDPYGFVDSSWAFTFTSDRDTYQSYGGLAGYLSASTITVEITGSLNGTYDGTYTVSISEVMMDGEFWALPKYGDMMLFLGDGTSTSVFALGDTGYTIYLRMLGPTAIAGDATFVTPGTTVSVSDYEGVSITTELMVKVSDEDYAIYGATSTLNAALVPESSNIAALAGLAVFAFSLLRRWRK